MIRLDKLLVAEQGVATRTLAQKLIESGAVAVEQAGIFVTATKPSQPVSPGTRVQVGAHPDSRYASRAGLKLEAALSQVAVSVAGALCLDVGQSTGGFTDCLLQKGASCVLGLEVGHDQLVPRLRQDPRVLCWEGFNARHLTREQLVPVAPEGFDVIVMDVSFISSTLITPAWAPHLKPSGFAIILVKPQFELGPDALNKSGLVRDASRYPELEQQLNAHWQQLGLQTLAYFPSPITGGDGNREFLAVLQPAPISPDGTSRY